jgi:hypothetical protein
MKLNPGELRSAKRNRTGTIYRGTAWLRWTDTTRVTAPCTLLMPSLFQKLIAAILEDDVVGVKALLKADSRLAVDAVEPDGRYEASIAHWIYAGDTALHVAAAGYHVEIATLLLAAGTDPNSARNHRQGQPLHYAADGHSDSPSWNPQLQVAMIRLLLKGGAKIHAQDKNGATPLHRAVRTRCAAAVKCLLQAGGDPALRNKSGTTPFHLAVQNTGRGGSGAEAAKTAQREIIHVFLEHGVSPTLKDGRGKSILEWAKSNGIRQILTGKRV